MTPIKDLVDALQETAPAAPLRLRQGVVVSVQEDESVTVRISGSETETPGLKCLSSYQRDVGDSVWLATDGTDWIVLGKLGRGDSWGNLDGGLPGTNFGGSVPVDGGGV